MGIRLDWEIEADKKNIRGTGEDPNARRARYGARVRVLFAIGIVLGLLAALAFFVADRLDQVNDEIEQVLRDTVDAEIAALRIGDWNAFVDYQRSASDVWIEQQRVLFEDYQSLGSLEEYVLISQEEMRVECRRRVVSNSGQWKTEIYGVGEQVLLKSIGLEIAIADLYRGVNPNS